jgi:A nuclease family of the HNH/ENDO VII superfamily with conserved AHH
LPKPRKPTHIPSLGKSALDLWKTARLPETKTTHHIIPWAKQSHPVIQKAAQSDNAFHMNEALNGIPLSTAVHNGSHANYDNLIAKRLDDFIRDNPNATTNQCYDALMDIINDIRAAIQNNPNIPINQLIF